MRTSVTLLALVLAVCATDAGRAESPDEAGRVAFFEKKVRPVLIDNCFSCHSAETKAQGGLRVDDRNGLVTGGNKGPAIVPGKPEQSLLLKRIGHADDKQRMPPKKQLTQEQIADLTTWVKDGAAWPAVRVPASVGKANPRYDELRKNHWAWQPLRISQPPAVRDTTWSRDDIDRFLLARLEEKDLKPVGDADRLTLLRRVTFDLTGLPPTLEAINSFTSDTSADAYEKVVDRLLASAAFGERWGRHWLDVARYGESTGSARNLPYPQAWRYRDWVIDAVNADVPYDQFLRAQIAGDLLPASTDREKDWNRIATGFLALGVKDVNQRFKVRFIMDNIDEQIDTVTRSVLALTVSCARCHDHKFDPIPTSDYYALAGIFHSTDLCAGLRNKMGGGGLDYFDQSLLVKLNSGKPGASPSADKVAALTRELDKAKAEWDAIRGTPKGLAKGPDGFPAQRPYRLRMEKLQADLNGLTGGASGETALGVREGKVIADTELRIRGEAEKLGPSVPRGFLSVLNVPDAPKIQPENSGRLELAQWLTSARNPLTPRVLVNRAWHHLFAVGLVTSVDNFGSTGDTPSHPELLDHLAARFVREGWSLKKLVRTLVLTRAYRLGAESPAVNREVDPSNRLVWRHSPRRLEAEEIRDATLVASGQLISGRPETSSARELKVVELRNNGPDARRIDDEAQASLYRSVYLPLLRGLTPRSLEVFDFAEQGMVTGQRDATTVSTQALYLLNDPFVRRQALVLADRLLARSDLDESARIQLAYRLTLGRLATTREVDRAKTYLAEYESAAREVFPEVARPRVEVIRERPKPVATTQEIPADPDSINPTDAPVNRDVIRPKNAKNAAWMSFAQALLGSAEFRYIR